jgi:ADP-ribosylation factor-binding protein GGA
MLVFINIKVTLLEINDAINSVLEKYGHFDSGKPITKSVIDLKRDETPVENEHSSPTKLGPINLIDLDEISTAGSSVSSVPVKNDLLGLDGFSSMPASVTIAQQGSVKNMDFLSDLVNLSTAIPVSNTNTSVVPNSSTSPSKNVDLLGEFDLLNLTPKPSVVTGTSSAVVGKEALLHDKNGLQIKLKMQIHNTFVNATAIFMNVTPVVFKDVNFQVSIPKSMSIKMEPISGTTLSPYNQEQLTQTLKIENPNNEALRLRYKLQYNINGAIVNEAGEFSSQ